MTQITSTGILNDNYLKTPIPQKYTYCHIGMVHFYSNTLFEMCIYSDCLTEKLNLIFSMHQHLEIRFNTCSFQFLLFDIVDISLMNSLRLHLQARPETKLSLKLELLNSDEEAYNTMFVLSAKALGFKKKKIYGKKLCGKLRY